MNTQALIDQVRLKMDDKITPYSFSDAEVLTALNDAQDEFARQTLCLFTGSAEITDGAVTGIIPLSDGILWVTSVSIGTPLRIVTQHELDFGYFGIEGVEASTRYTGWRTTTGTPTFCLPNYGVQALNLIPKPAANVTITLDYYRLPTAQIGLGPEVLAEIPSPYHSDLVIGACAYLYDVPDQELYDKEAVALKQLVWQKRIARAALLLQTALRMQVRLLTPPPGVGFVQSENG